MVVEMVEPTTIVRHLATHRVALSEHTKGIIQPLVPLIQVDAILMSARALKSVEALLVSEVDATLKDIPLVTTHKRVAQPTTMASRISIEETSDAALMPTSNASVNLIVLLDMTRGNFVKSAILKARTDQQTVNAKSLQDAHSMMNNSRVTTSISASITVPIHLVTQPFSALPKRANMTKITLAKLVM
jgi:hypothetical protein